MPATAPFTSVNTFGDLLRQLRRRNGLSQGELAAQVGFSVAQLSRLEQNRRLPNLSAIAEVFIPALGLQSEPRLAQRLLELAALARGERPPVALERTQKVQATIREEWVESATPLPSAPTALIGRERTLRDVTKRVMESAGRLVTLVGPPGVGKTRLALAVVEQLQPLFADGAHFVPLAAVSDPALVPSTLVAALSLSENSQKPPQTQLVEALRRQEVLLVLDNFEQVSAAAPQVAHLLEQCARLRILVTSREALHLRAEQRFKTPPLEPADAVELFLRRAQAINPDFAVTPENSAQIVQLCLQLDCLPLAIELAAARSELFSLSQLLTQLQRGRLRLLEGGGRDLPDRQRTLRNAIAWSYQLLDAEAQQLFRWLAVFVGGFALEMLAAVIGDQQPNRSLAAEPVLVTKLQLLLDSNLLVIRDADVTGKHRYDLLQTIGEFALEEATQRAEIDAMRRHHARYFYTWAAQQVPWSFEFAEGIWWQQLEQEHDNLRAALQWSLQHDSEQALRLAVALHPYWGTRGYQNEGSRWLTQALALNPSPTRLRAQGLLKASNFAYQGMDFGPADFMLAEALQIVRAINDLTGEVECLNALGWLANAKAAMEQARQYFEESLVLARRLDNRALLATTLSNLVHVIMDAALYPITHAYVEESLAIFRELKQPHGIAMALRQKGMNETYVGNYAVAVAALHEAIDIWQQRGGHRELAWTVEMLGEGYWLLGDIANARRYWTESFARFEEVEEEFGKIVVYHHLGQVERVSGNLAQAADNYVRSLKYFYKKGAPYFISRLLAGLGGVALGGGQLETAAQLLGAAYRLFASVPPFLAPADKADYARLVEDVRSRLGEEGFCTAWEAGNNLNMEQGTELGLAFGNQMAEQRVTTILRNGRLTRSTIA